MHLQGKSLGTLLLSSGPLLVGRRCRSTHRPREGHFGPVSKRSEIAAQGTTWSGGACHEDPAAEFCLRLEAEWLRPGDVQQSGPLFERQVPEFAAA